jgi:hypothetical protein
MFHPVIEVQAKPVRFNLPFEILVRRRDDPNVDGDLLDASQTVELLLFQDPQQLHLDGRRQLADFVEENRASVGGLDLAHLSPRGGAR